MMHYILGCGLLEGRQNNRLSVEEEQRRYYCLSLQLLFTHNSTDPFGWVTWLDVSWGQICFLSRSMLPYEGRTKWDRGPIL